MEFAFKIECFNQRLSDTYSNIRMRQACALLQADICSQYVLVYHVGKESGICATFFAVFLKFVKVTKQGCSHLKF